MATFSDWQEVGSPTVSVETTKVFAGTSSAKVVAGGSIGQLTQVLTDNLDGNISQILSQNVTAKCFVWASVANAARIRLDWDGGTTLTSSLFHEGNSEWEELEIDVAPPSGTIQVEITLETAANQTAYFDSCSVAIRPIAKYTIPAAFIIGPNRVTQTVSRQEPNKWELVHPNGRPLRHMGLLLEGMAYLSSTSVDADTMEIEGGRVDLLVARAAEFLYAGLASRAIGQERSDYQQEVAIWQTERVRLQDRPGVKMPPVSTDIAPAWHIQTDSQSRYVVFDNVRG